MQPSSAVDPGRSFRLVEGFGRSAVGDVYLAELVDPVDGRREQVVIKVLNVELARLGPVWERMRREARALGWLSHPHIAAPRDVVQFQSRRAIVTDLVPGADLDHVLAALELTGERFPARAAFEVVGAVARALDAASTFLKDGVPLGLRHRDLKPSNVRITSTGGVKVLDFGLARGPHEPEATNAGLVGTESYMSPERLLNTGDGPEGDVYGAAATLVELLLGRPLGRSPILPDPHATFVEECVRSVSTQLGGPTAVVSRALDLLRSALHVRPEERPSALVLALAFEEIAQDLDGEALQPFAGRFLPSIDRVLGRMRTPVAGVLSERPSEEATEGTLSWTPAPLPYRMGMGMGMRRPAVVGWLVGAAVASALCGAGSMFVFARLHSFAEVAPADPAAAPAAISPAGPRASVAAAPSASAGPRGEVVERALFAVRGASAIEVTCGDVSATGTTNARISGFTAGTCSVVATTIDGGTVARGDVVVDRAQRVLCDIDGAALRCGPTR